MTLSGQYYRCSAGESFDAAALAVYGDEKFAAELLQANPELGGLALFQGGEILRLPVVEVPEDEDEQDNLYMPATAPWKE